MGASDGEVEVDPAPKPKGNLGFVLACIAGFGFFGLWIAFHARPAVYVQNETGRTWSQLKGYRCWPDEVVVFAQDVKPGDQIAFNGRCECGYNEGFAVKVSPACDWALSAVYEDTGEEVALISYWTPYRAPLFFVWRDRRLVLTVHENNGVEITRRFW